MFNLNGSAGTYNVGLNNVVITNAFGVNILTGYYPSYVKITAPDISGETNIDFGEISVLDTLLYDYQLSNFGDDTLFVTEFECAEKQFYFVEWRLYFQTNPRYTRTGFHASTRCLFFTRIWCRYQLTISGFESEVYP